MAILIQVTNVIITFFTYLPASNIVGFDSSALYSG